MRKDKKLKLNAASIPNLIVPRSNYTDFLKKHNIKHESLQLRHDALKSNRRLNYINEYDRIQGMLSHNITHGHYDYQRLKNRQADLKKLFDESFKKPLHEIYN